MEHTRAILCKLKRDVSTYNYRHDVSGPTSARHTATHPRQAWRWACVVLPLLLLLSACVGSTPPATPITPTTFQAGTASPHPVTTADWTMYHADAARTGYIASTPNPRSLSRLWQTHLDGAVYAEPLVVRGHVLVATEHNSIYALDARTGQVQWRTTIGQPVSLSSLPCGNIDPLGITGTPVYDPRTNLVFAVAEIANPGVAHVLVGVDVETGTVKVRRSADPPGADPRVHQQRAALALAGDRVYVAYGGLYGDCGEYHGMVVAARTDGTGNQVIFQVPTRREGGIWAPPGPVLDAQGNLYVSVGNGAATAGDWDHTDSVLRLSPTLQLQDGFAPESWQDENAADADLGSMAPVLLPGGLIYANGKGGQGYLLRADHLGGVGGQIQAQSVCSAYGGAAVSGQSFFIPCTSGVRQLNLTSGAPNPRVTIGWHAPGRATGSPVVGGQTVYSLDPGGTLYALDAATGAVRVTLAVGATSRFATPSLSGNSIFIGTLAGVTAAAIVS